MYDSTANRLHTESSNFQQPCEVLFPFLLYIWRNWGTEQSPNSEWQSCDYIADIFSRRAGQGMEVMGGAQGFEYAKYALYHWAAPPAPNPSILDPGYVLNCQMQVGKTLNDIQIWNQK
jgi:hypothetical protein